MANGQCGSYIGSGKSPTNKGLFQTTRYGVVTYGEGIDSTYTGTGGTAIQMTQSADLVSVDHRVINGDVVTGVADAASDGADVVELIDAELYGDIATGSDADTISLNGSLLGFDLGHSGLTVVAAYSQGASNNDVTDEDTRRPSMMLDLNRSGAPMTLRRFTATPKPRSLWRQAPAKPPMMASS